MNSGIRLGKKTCEDVSAALKKVKKSGNLNGIKTNIVKMIKGGSPVNVPLVKYIEIEELKDGSIIMDTWVLTSEGSWAMRSPYTMMQGRIGYRRRIFDDARAWDNQRLPTEYLDALKSIQQTGHPNTEKMDVVERLQLLRLAALKDGKWSLEYNGINAIRDYIRKSECAQFSGKVR